MKRTASYKKKLDLKIDFKDRRRFIRHPVCYPLKFRIMAKGYSEKSMTLNISEGGLLFLSKKKVLPGTLLELSLPFEDKVFKAQARVVHVTPEKNKALFNVGVAFHRISDALKVKLLEQLYLIDEYRHLRSIQLGREVAFQEASREWIKLYSKKFKKLYW